MSLWKILFGSKRKADDQPVQKETGDIDVIGEKLPSNMLQPEFGEVRVGVRGNVRHVQFTVLMGLEGKDVEGWQTGVALDASGSMKGSYGKGLDPGPKGEPPEELVNTYFKKGWIETVEQGGNTYYFPNPECEVDLVQKGYRRWSQNIVESQARKFTSYLADNLDADGGTTVIYWACGDGSQIEELGDFTAEQCENAEFQGPVKYSFGERTILTPAVQYFVERFKDAKNGMYIFITDGELHDLDDVKRYTIRLCKEIQMKKRNPVKCVLIGLGDSVNEEQMEELDELDSGTDIDIWDHKIAAEMHNILEIFTELVTANRIVATTARILDASDNIVANITDGLPAKYRFTMPANSPYFVLDVAGKKIKQTVQLI
ncbi:MAG: vWA domain-containing protein [bacterium]